MRSWTELGQDAENFSGTAQYTITFAKPDLETYAFGIIGRAYDYAIETGG